MDTQRMLDSLLGGSRGNALGGRGLDGLLGAFGGGGAAPRQGGAHMGGGRSSGALGGGGLGDLLGGLLGGGRAGAPSGGMGGGLGDLLGGLARGGGGGLGGMVRPPMGGGIGSAAAGGLLGSMLGGGRGGGGLLRMGGMGLLGLLAYRAYQQHMEQQGAQASGKAAVPATDEFARAEAPARDGQPFGLAVVKAMIAAAKSDGILDEQERERIFGEAERLDLEAHEKGLVFEALRTEPDPQAIAASAQTEAQRAELYLASCMVIGAASSSERAYLDALAHHLGLAPGLRASLDQQAREAAEVTQKMG
jgi:uncharacterized membrane protein YebE (DUF533 family)